MILVFQIMMMIQTALKLLDFDTSDIIALSLAYNFWSVVCHCARGSKQVLGEGVGN